MNQQTLVRKIKALVKQEHELEAKQDRLAKKLKTWLDDDAVLVSEPTDAVKQQIANLSLADKIEILNTSDVHGLPFSKRTMDNVRGLTPNESEVNDLVFLVVNRDKPSQFQETIQNNIDNLAVWKSKNAAAITKHNKPMVTTKTKANVVAQQLAAIRSEILDLREEHLPVRTVNVRWFEYQTRVVHGSVDVNAFNDQDAIRQAEDAFNNGNIESHHEDFWEEDNVLDPDPEFELE